MRQGGTSKMGCRPSRRANTVSGRPRGSETDSDNIAQPKGGHWSPLRAGQGLALPEKPSATAGGGKNASRFPQMQIAAKGKISKIVLDNKKGWCYYPFIVHKPNAFEQKE